MFDTIIIGAGIAGLAAGEYLHNHSQDNFIILESFHKIGGRVQTIEFANKTFSTGPGWVHGKEGNPIFDILSDMKISMKLADSMSPGSYFVYDTIESKDVTESYIERRSAINDMMETITEKLHNEILDPEKTFEDLLSENSKLFIKLTDFDRTVIFSCLELYMGAPLNEISGATQFQNDEIYHLDEGIINYRILDPFGVPKLIKYLSRNFEDKIHLNCKVKSIDWQNDSNYVVVMLADGQQFVGKNVIITVQSDLLAKGTITFQPKLPDEKLIAWTHVPAVNYCRIFAKFPRKFWPDNEWFLPILKDVEPFNELLIWQNGYKQNLCSEDDYILICHYTSGWKRKSCRFDVDKKQLIQLVTEAMRNIFPNDYCEPTEVQFVSHLNNSRFAGSFSVPAPGMTKSDIEQLRQSVGPLHFAGESVIVELIGTMQAAYLSGQNAARNIL